MYLPTQGASRDRTTDFNYLRSSDKDTYINDHDSRKKVSDSTFLIPHETSSNESMLEPFFQLAQEVKTEFQSLSVTYSSLLKAQQQSMRPTFTDPGDQFANVNRLTNAISSQLKEIQNKINYFESPLKPTNDRSKIIKNIRTALQERYNEFNSNFKMTLQTFSESYISTAKANQDDSQDTIDYSTFNFGDNTTLEQEREYQQSNANLEELSRRAQKVKEIFVELADLIEDQGTIVDRIDCNISSTLENAKAAHNEVEEAAAYQKKSRMWIVVIILAIFVLFLIVIIIMK